MDQIGSLVDTKLKIYPSKELLDFIKILTDDDLPANILKLKGQKGNKESEGISTKHLEFNNRDYQYLNKIKEIIDEKYGKVEKREDCNVNDTQDNSIPKFNDTTKEQKAASKESLSSKEKEQSNSETLVGNDVSTSKREDPYLVVTDLDWLYAYLNEQRQTDKNIPYLHNLLENCEITMPENKIIKRNPVLEARCVKLRAQQEAREYRKMTKTVDNVRLRFPEDSISYQLKQLNRQLIAIGQFLLSIFAGFLFGFRGVEWMVGNLDFGFRLLLGVMCALVIALAEIYFLAKKLNEELSIPETVQLGGPPKFAENSPYSNSYSTPNKITTKEHQD